MINNNTYYRPVWTCGRYDANTKSAIMYNLIAGLSYFFEDSSADLIGAILDVSRGSLIPLKRLSEVTNISLDSISKFMVKLEEEKLVSKESMTDSVISHYRTSSYMEKIKESLSLSKSSYPNIDAITAERLYSNRSGKRIISMMFELTYDCSERCLHCYNPGATRNNKEKSERHKYNNLTKKDFKRIIDECYDEGMVKMCLSGGDPFSNPYAWDIIKYLYDKEVAIEIYTNGQGLVGKENLLASFFPCDVGISIYSADSNVHDAITRVKGSWNKTINVLEKLSSLSVPTEIKCCIMRPNLKSYYPLITLAKKTASYLQLQSSVFDSMDGDKCVSENLLLTPEEMELALSDDNNPLYVGKNLENYGELEHSLNENACHAGFGSFCITPSGEFVLCSSFDASLGNLKSKSVAEVLDNPQLLKWQALTLRQYEECGRHEYCSFCQICPGLNFSENGTPLKASKNSCYVAKIRFNMATKIKNGQDVLNGKSLKEKMDSLPQYKVPSLNKEIGINHYGNSLNI